MTCGRVCCVCTVPGNCPASFLRFSLVSLSLSPSPFGPVVCRLGVWQLWIRHLYPDFFFCRPVILCAFVFFFLFPFSHADVIASVSKNCSLIIFPMAASPDRRVNLAVARIIPPILLGIVIYACYAVTKQLCSKSFVHLLRDLPRKCLADRIPQKTKLTT